MKSQFSDRRVLAYLARHRTAASELLHAAAAALALAGADALSGRSVAGAPLGVLLAGIQWSVWRAWALPHRSWRLWGARDLLDSGAAAVCAALAAGMAARLALGSFPWTWMLLDALLCFGWLAGMRIGVRVALDRWSAGPEQKRVLVYGAGRAGAGLLAALRAHPEWGRRVTGFVDDDPARQGRRLDGVRVLGGGDALAEVARRTGASEVLLAMPAATAPQLAAARARCRAAGLAFRLLPRLAAQLGEPQARRTPEELLGRIPAELREAVAPGVAEDRVILVTGAAGSIGAELCRQLARRNPQRVVAFDQSESGLFELEQELAAVLPGRFTAEIGDIRDSQRVAEVLARHRPQAVFHAAALKHVPLMEQHPFEALATNALASARLAAACHRQGVERFVLVSTDKAVAPASVMGATKLLAERLCLSLPGPARVIAVRFGNVLDSHGSVVPAFRRQIQQGGPIRITHPEMRRFLMTIPEAAQLLLFAAGAEAAREVLVLQMGEPVRIVDLALRMLSLEGLEPERDVPIAFTGMRPGEKLSEELVADDEVSLPSPHPLIRRVQTPAWAEKRAQRLTARLEQLLARRDPALLDRFWEEALPGFAARRSATRRSPAEAASADREVAHGETGGDSRRDPVEAGASPRALGVLAEDQVFDPEEGTRQPELESGRAGVEGAATAGEEGIQFPSAVGAGHVQRAGGDERRCAAEPGAPKRRQIAGAGLEPLGGQA